MAVKGLRARKRIRIKCAFQALTGNMYSGTTRNISITSAFMECQPLIGAVNRRPKMNDMGMIKLFFNVDVETVTINSRCRIINVFPDGLELDVQFAYMSKVELEYLGMIMRSA